jgi:hypothetical protein
MSKIMGAPKPPPMPKPEPVAPMEDTQAIEAARRRRMAAASQRSGVQSTILSQGGTAGRETLGGG